MFQLFVIACVIASVGAFRSFSPVVRPINTKFTIVAMSEESDIAEVSDSFEEDKKLFDMNRIVRLGRSRDQDGKSNIWSIEPTMQVVEEEGSDPNQIKKNLIIGGVVIGAAIAVLPLFNAFSSLLPDPSNY
eukprot:gene7221-9852_t